MLSRASLTVEYFINAQGLIIAGESFQSNHGALQGRETLDLVRGCGEGGERSMRGAVRIEHSEEA